MTIRLHSVWTKLKYTHTHIQEQANIRKNNSNTRTWSSKRFLTSSHPLVSARWRACFFLHQAVSVQELHDNRHGYWKPGYLDCVNNSITSIGCIHFNISTFINRMKYGRFYGICALCTSYTDISLSRSFSRYGSTVLCFQSLAIYWFHVCRIELPSVSKGPRLGVCVKISKSTSISFLHLEKLRRKLKTHLSSKCFDTQKTN